MRDTEWLAYHGLHTPSRLLFSFFLSSLVSRSGISSLPGKRKKDLPPPSVEQRGGSLRMSVVLDVREFSSVYLSLSGVVLVSFFVSVFL